MTAEKPNRSGTGRAAETAQAPAESDAKAEAPEHSVPAPLSLEALQRLRARLARKYH